ncbi:MAG TPA: aldo/keto reductase, partial [Gaiellaceae bacterium]|nr:aldo/keto reductase [Gaiellaceae bacterium]
HQYSYLARDVEEAILPLALERGLGVIVWAPLASGFLTDGFDLDALEPGDFRRTHAFAELDLDAARSELRRDGGTAARGAIRWVLANPAVTGAIVGVRNEREAKELQGFTT